MLKVFDDDSAMLARMDIDIIIEPDMTPAQVAEIALEAERLGVRAIWASNYHTNWDPFVSLVPAAMATSKIILGVLAMSPWEMHPLKMANALLSLNEMAGGRAMIAVGGGGALIGALGWRSGVGKPIWPGRDPVKGTRLPPKRVRGVREALEILKIARTGEVCMGYEGGIFDVTRPFIMDWATHEGPLIYSCSSGPMMIRMGGQYADGIQLSDYTPDMMPGAIENLEAGFAKRDDKPDDFRVGNFWAFHIKKDAAASYWEGRRELYVRGGIVGREREQIEKFCVDEAETDLVMENIQSFRQAFLMKRGEIKNISEELANRLVDGMASAGDLSALDREIERYKTFADAGLTELSLRLHNDPMESLKIIGEHVIPALR